MARKNPTVLTNLELSVMRVVWGANGEPLTVREVTERLNEQHPRALAYNTVQTMLTILKDKGAVKVKRGPGRAHLYLARLSRDQITTSMVGDLVERLFDGRIEPLLLHLMDTEKVSRDELETLRRSIVARLDDEEESP
ncbi:MAG: BlaI/MecI/CopY family transcriptional regulator [Planctomycetes bacterium]|nr:BlaI/MecI/CopY family transcriptional regulator [Planctomycetota bacterium]